MSSGSESLAVEHETAFVRSFIIRERRERYLSQLARTRKRHRFLERLNHQFHKDLDPRWMGDSPPAALPVGEHPCYLIASEKNLDGRILPAREVLQVMSAACFGIVASFVPGTIAAYKDEAPAEVVWLYRD